MFFDNCYVIAACILIASIWTNRDKELKNWFAELAVDFEKVKHFYNYFLLFGKFFLFYVLFHLCFFFFEKSLMSVIVTCWIFCDLLSMIIYPHSPSLHLVYFIATEVHSTRLAGIVDGARCVFYVSFWSLDSSRHEIIFTFAIANIRIVRIEKQFTDREEGHGGNAWTRNFQWCRKFLVFLPSLSLWECCRCCYCWNEHHLQILDIQKIILNLYSVWKSFDEKEQLVPILQKIPRPNPGPQNSNGGMVQSHSHNNLTMNGINMHQNVSMGPPQMPPTGSMKFESHWNRLRYSTI